MNTHGLSTILLLLLPTVVLAQPAVAQSAVPHTGAAEIASAMPAGPALAQPSSPDSSETLSLEAVVRAAVANNPSVQAALHAYQAKLDRVPQAKALPDPKVGAGWMGNPAPFRVKGNFPPSYRSFTASQEIPFPGKLALRGQMATKEAKAAWWEYEAARRQVVVRAKTAYYQYYYLTKAIDITQKNKDLLEKLSHIAENRYRVGKGVQQDVLKSQTELSLLLQRLTVLEQQRGTAEARMNTLMSRSPESPLAPPANVQPATLHYSLDDLYQLAAKNDTGLEGDEQRIARSRYAVQLARKDFLPDFSVGYSYQQRPILDDTQGFTVSVNVPIFYKSKQREAEREAAQKMIAAHKAQDARRDDVNFGVKQAYLAAKASRDLMQLYSRAVVPQASLALEASMSSYQVGNVDFLSVLANFSNVLEYEVDYYREVAAYQTALAELEPLVGVRLTGEVDQTPAPESR